MRAKDRSAHINIATDCFLDETRGWYILNGVETADSRCKNCLESHTGCGEETRRDAWGFMSCRRCFKYSLTCYHDVWTGRLEVRNEDKMRRRAVPDPERPLAWVDTPFPVVTPHPVMVRGPARAVTAASASTAGESIDLGSLDEETRQRVRRALSGPHTPGPTTEIADGEGQTAYVTRARIQTPGLRGSPMPARFPASNSTSKETMPRATESRPFRAKRSHSPESGVPPWVRYRYVGPRGVDSHSTPASDAFGQPVEASLPSSPSASDPVFTPQSDLSSLQGALHDFTFTFPRDALTDQPFSFERAVALYDPTLWQWAAMMARRTGLTPRITFDSGSASGPGTGPSGLGL